MNKYKDLDVEFGDYGYGVSNLRGTERSIPTISLDSPEHTNLDAAFKKLVDSVEQMPYYVDDVMDLNIVDDPINKIASKLDDIQDVMSSTTKFKAQVSYLVIPAWMSVMLFLLILWRVW